MPRLSERRFLPEELMLDEAEIFRHTDNVTLVNETAFGRGYLTAACDVSNDPPDGLVDLRVCNITQYQCNPPQVAMEERAQEAGATVSGIVLDFEVPFDYEIQYHPQAQFSRVLPFVEESILESLAASMGLTKCAASGGRRRRLGGGEFTEEQRSSFVGVSLDPRDKVDTRVNECAYPVVEDSQCRPIQGAVTVSIGLSHNNRALVESVSEMEDIREAINNVIQSRMDSGVYEVSGNIEKVVYVGDRGALEASRTTTGGQAPSDDDDGGLSGLGKGLVGAAAFLLLLVILAFLLIVRRRRKGDNQREGGNISPVNSDAFLQDDDEPWSRRRGGSDDDPRSLAYNDSLALAPQVVVPLDDKSDTSTASSQSALDRILGTQQDYSPRREDASESSTSAASPVDHLGTPPRVPKRRIRPVLPAGSEDTLQMGNGYHEDDLHEYASDSTPRRVLQMS